ncbi:MAG: 3-phosphoshikimate 1-carboxyvinyltransferase [Gemmatimonadota bacterium]
MSRSASPRVVRVPGDKSISHRALLLAALAEGRSSVRGILTGQDLQATAAVLRRLGVDVPELAAELAFEGVGAGGLRAPELPLDCGNSGTTARLLLGILAGCAFRAEVRGDASLSMRPMGRVTEPLTRMGARFEALDEPGCLPLAVTGGPLSRLVWDSPHASAQVKSALLLAAHVGGTEVRVTEPLLSRDHTERMLAAAGVPVQRGTAEDGRPWVALAGGAPLGARAYVVPADPSAAAFPLALALLGGTGPVEIPGVCVNPTRAGFLAVLERMGAVVEVVDRREESGEPVATLRAEPGSLRATEVAAEELPALIEEVPVLAILAARAEGETRFTGAAELRVKETDRLAALAANLRAVGVAAEELPDGLVVQGTDAPLRGRVQARGDHRIAMAFGVLGATPGADIQVDDPAVAGVSFPGFWELLAELGRR